MAQWQTRLISAPAAAVCIFVCVVLDQATRRWLTTLRS